MVRPKGDTGTNDMSLKFTQSTKTINVSSVKKDGTETKIELKNADVL